MFSYFYWEEDHTMHLVTGEREGVCPVCLQRQSGGGPASSVVVCGGCLLRVHTLCAHIEFRPMRWMCLACVGSD